jgi:hypothetical protein
MRRLPDSGFVDHEMLFEQPLNKLPTPVKIALGDVINDDKGSSGVSSFHRQLPKIAECEA